MIKTQKYFAVFRLSFFHGLRNYKSLIGLSIFLMTCLIIFAHLWKFAAAKAGAVTYDPQQLLWYIALNEWVLVAIPDIQEEMEQDLRSGRLAYLLPRPISYLGASFAEAAGTLCVNLLILGLVTFSFTWWQTGSLPFDSLGFVLTLFFGGLAGVVAIIFQMLIGFSAFWLHEVSPFHWIWEKMLFMLGGLMVPLATYPILLQKFAHFTPFPAILGQRSALTLEFNSQAVWMLGSTLLGWSLCGLLCLWIVYRQGLRILNVEGG